MKLIENIIINQLEFHITTRNIWIYIRVWDGETLCGVDNFLLGYKNEQLAQNLFNDIGKKIQFPLEIKQSVVPFKFLGVIKNYSSVDIIQTTDYIEMSYKIIFLDFWNLTVGI